MKNNIKQDCTQKYKFSAFELAEVLSTRICHDFAGPISAVNNGLELFTDTNENDEMYEPIMQMMQLSSQESLAKLQMLRMAYGQVSEGTSGEIAEMQSIVEKFFAASKIQIEWSIPTDTTKITTQNRRILTLMVLNISGILIFGGIIAINLTADNLTIKGSNSRIKEDVEYGKILGNVREQMPALTTKNVPLYYLSTIIDALEKEIEYSQNLGEISIATGIIL